jgi:glycosyltransferase involved in cell wall biosynthesis
MYSVVVVDNDEFQSAKSTVLMFAREKKIEITYVSEPEQNIALARNRAVRNSKGKYLAFIDDDEFPVEDWLLRLHKICEEHNVDGVLGPVNPLFELEPPEWIIKGGLHNRKKFKTGVIIKNPRDMRTGNVLLAFRIFDGMEVPFNHRYGKIGGEDTDFFRRMMEKGCKFIWCDEAPVYETIPPERMNRVYFLKRALLRGVVAAKSQSFSLLGTVKSFIAIILYLISLPILQLAGHHFFMIYLVKLCDHTGKLLTTIGFDVIKERT